jgi:hypothetical protein
MKYRGVAIDPGQSKNRIVPANPPEARVLAATKAEELITTAKAGRQKMPGDLECMEAVIAGLSAPDWRSETHYCALFDSHKRAVPRPGRRLDSEANSRA